MHMVFIKRIFLSNDPSVIYCMRELTILVIVVCINVNNLLILLHLGLIIVTTHQVVNAIINLLRFHKSYCVAG